MANPGQGQFVLRQPLPQGGQVTSAQLLATGLPQPPRPQISSASLLGPTPTIPSRPPPGSVPSFAPSIPPRPTPIPVSRPSGFLDPNAPKSEDNKTVISSASLLGMPSASQPSTAAPTQTSNSANANVSMEQQKKRKLEEFLKEGMSEAEIGSRLRMAKAIKTDETKIGRPDWSTPFASFDDAMNRLLPFHLQYKEEAPLSDRELVPFDDPMCVEILTDIHELNRTSSCGVGKEEQLLMMRLSIADAKGRVDARKELEGKLKEQTKKIAANQKQKQQGGQPLPQPPKPQLTFNTAPTSYTNLVAPSGQVNAQLILQQQIKLLQEQQLKAIQAKTAAANASNAISFTHQKPSIVPPPSITPIRLPPPPSPLISSIKPPTITSLPPPPTTAPTLGGAPNNTQQMLNALKTTLNFNSLSQLTAKPPTLAAPTFPSPLNRNPFPTMTNPLSFQPKPLNLSLNPTSTKLPEPKRPQ